ncbi:hypothetical protein QJS10_CPA09g00481 [Acorus calamus]|uniref:BZIP domain-containing protein n=1 Tax=Acorus calamus TaxID=4465 RepID=A0AAV9E7U7_ACOCL|nr:hypothetical protein QJS10_CPA09g00481 [Acorus calamus]
MMQIASQHAKHEFASASNSSPPGFEYLLYNGVFDTLEGNEWLQSQVAVQQHHHQGEMVGSVSNIMPDVTVHQQPDCLLGVTVQQPPHCSLQRTNVGSCSGSALLDSQVTASSKELSKKEKRMIKNRESAARSRAKKQVQVPICPYNEVGARCGKFKIPASVKTKDSMDAKQSSMRAIHIENYLERHWRCASRLDEGVITPTGRLAIIGRLGELENGLLLDLDPTRLQICVNPQRRRREDPYDPVQKVARRLKN